MTDTEKAIAMAYTGVCFLAGDKLQVFYDYAKTLMGRAVYTHELPSIAEELKEIENFSDRKTMLEGLKEMR